MKVLLAIDGSEESLEAASFLARLPLHGKPVISVLSVLEDYADVEVPVDWAETEEQDAAMAFGAVKTIFQKIGYETSHLTRRGHPSRTTLSVAKEVDADLIVLGARGHSAIYRVILGSTADFVANHAQCSVLVVRPEAEPNNAATAFQVMLAYDGSPGDKASVSFDVADCEAVNVPKELQFALDANDGAASVWEKWTAGKRRAQCLRVSSAKKVETRERRAEEVIALCLAELGMQSGITAWQAFENLDIRAGTITAVENLPKARKPAYRVTVDFGPELGVKRTSAQITANYTQDELVGRQIIGVVNIPPKQIGTFMSEFLIVGFYRDDGSVILAVPDDSIPNGAKLA